MATASTAITQFGTVAEVSLTASTDNVVWSFDQASSGFPDKLAAVYLVYYYNGSGGLLTSTSLDIKIQYFQQTGSVWVNVINGTAFSLDTGTTGFLTLANGASRPLFYSTDSSYIQHLESSRIYQKLSASDYDNSGSYGQGIRSLPILALPGERITANPGAVSGIKVGLTAINFAPANV